MGPCGVRSFISIMVMLFLFVEVKASVTAISMKSRDKLYETRWPFNGKPPKISLKSASVLQKLKEAELKEDWVLCVRRVPAALKGAALVSPWIHNVELRCAWEAAQKSNKFSSLLSQAVQNAKKNPQNLFIGPWAKELFDRVIDSELWLAKQEIKSQKKKSWQRVNDVLKYGQILSNSKEAEALAISAELSYLEQKTEAAEFLFRQSLDKRESVEVRARLKTVQAALEKKNKKISSDPVERLISDPKLEATPEELELEARIKESISKGAALSAIADAVDLLRRFPGGRRAEWASDKVLELYQSLLQKNDSNLDLARDKARKQMSKAPSTRLVDWVQKLHRYGDYVSVLDLSEKALDDLEGAPVQTQLHYYAGRSAHFIGEYEKAQKHFLKLAQQSAGTNESLEALFRLGLIAYRQQQFSAAVSYLEKLLKLPGIDRFELNSRYWLARSLEKVNMPRSIEEKNIILSRYPFSYYGLRLNSENNKGLISWADPQGKKDIQYNYWLTSSQKETWQRFLLLNQAGWFDEARAESVELPTPKEPEAKILFARYLASALSYPTAIRLVNDAGDQDPQLRRLDYIRIGFPDDFDKQINQEAQKYNLNPILIKSLIRQESAYNMKAVSTSNAMGLMQLIPPTAQEVATDLKIKKLNLPEDAFKPELNIQLGTQYLAKVLNQANRNIPIALGSYNAGPHRLNKWLSLRDETKDLAQNPSSSPESEIWFDELPWGETSFYIKAILRNTLIYQMLDKSPVKLEGVLWQNMVVSG